LGVTLVRARNDAEALAHCAERDAIGRRFASVSGMPSSASSETI
jgi:hypothetical protein